MAASAQCTGHQRDKHEPRFCTALHVLLESLFRGVEKAFPHHGRAVVITRKHASGTAKEPVRHATVSTVGTQHVFSCVIYTSFRSYGFYFPILFCQIILPSETYVYSFQTDARSLRHISTRHLKTHGMRHQAFVHVTARFLPYSANHKHTAQARLQTNARRPACAIHEKAV